MISSQTPKAHCNPMKPHFSNSPHSLQDQTHHSLAGHAVTSFGVNYSSLTPKSVSSHNSNSITNHNQISLLHKEESKDNRSTNAINHGNINQHSISTPYATLPPIQFPAITTYSHPGLKHQKILKKLRSGAAFEAASVEILAAINGDGKISMEEVVNELSRFEKMCNIIEEKFPGSRTSKNIVELTDKTLLSKGLNPSNTIFAQSVCPDEINHRPGEVTNLFADKFCKVFHLGGLAGIPFTGRTGFGAFANHVPDDGSIFILFAPHIGLSHSCMFGSYSRQGQHEDGDACGAAVGALNYCLDCKNIPNHHDLGSNPYDYQMSYITHEISKRLKNITNHIKGNDRQVELVNQMYEIAKEFLDNIVSLKIGRGISNIVILGGIQINMPSPLSDFFQPLLFEIRRADGVVDLMDAFHV